MKHTEEESINIKQAVSEMWLLVESQVKRSHTALLSYDKNCAHEVISREKSVDSFELYIDRKCENYIALFNPVAVDLRFVIALMQINNNLERIGDFAYGIATYVAKRQENNIPSEILEKLSIEKMFDTVLLMLEDCKRSLINEDSSLISRVFSQDNILDGIEKQSIDVLAEYVTSHPQYLKQSYELYAIIRRLERMGDRINNIAENVIFFIEAKEVKHSSK